MIKIFNTYLILFIFTYLSTSFGYNNLANLNTMNKVPKRKAIDLYILQNQENARNKQFQFKRFRENQDRDQEFQFGPGSGSGSGTDNLQNHRPGLYKMKSYAANQNIHLSLCDYAYLALIILNDAKMSQREALQNLLLQEIETQSVENYSDDLTDDVNIYELKCNNYDPHLRSIYYRKFFQDFLNKYKLDSNAIRSIFDIPVNKSMNLS